MQLCRRCKGQEAAIHITHSVDGKEAARTHLCEECAKPFLLRQEAYLHGPQPCFFCGRGSFLPLVVVRKIIYACCKCRGRHSQIFLKLCADERPELALRSENKISFFDTCLEPEIEEWANFAGNKAIEILKQEVRVTCDSNS